MHSGESLTGILIVLACVSKCGVGVSWSSADGGELRCTGEVCS
jgi:hypothetical protein